MRIVKKFAYLCHYERFSHLKYLRMKKLLCSGLFFWMVFAVWAADMRVNLYQPVVPVLTQHLVTPVLRIQVIKGCMESCKLERMCCTLNGTTDRSDIEEVLLCEANEKGRMGKCLLTVSGVKRDAFPKQVVFADVARLQMDTTYFWIAVRLKEKVDLSHRIVVNCSCVETSVGRADIAYSRPLVPLRVGVAVRRHGQDGVHTSRIPGIVTSESGTLMAIYDARYEGSRDLQGHIDIAMNRSVDGGQTWLPMQVVLDRKEWGGLPEKYNGVSDACILKNDQNGDIYVAGLWMHGVLNGQTGKWVEHLTADSTRWIHQWIAKGSQPGVDVKQTCQFLITKSSDDGRTWSTPVNITAQTKRPEWWLFAPAPGHGITLRDGTLVFPTQGRDENGHPFSNITWSKDGGKTWTASSPAYHNTTECMAVELADGGIMLNMRDNRNHGHRENNGRRICVTYDLGQTWKEHVTSRKALIEPTCMASLHRHRYKKGKSILLFCNPESYNSRDHMTLKISCDDGMTWPTEKKILLDEYGGFGYSCITSVRPSVVGVLYESSQAQIVGQ